MHIYGLQKLSLLDYPGKLSCIVFFGGCDFRCPFCHNFPLATKQMDALMEEEKLLSFLQSRQGRLEGVVISGGEPLLQKELPVLLKSIRALGYPIKLDTNGTHPDRLAALLEEGLVDYVAMDIKNSPAKYAYTAGVNKVELSCIDKSIQLLIKGSVDYEFRTTVAEPLHKLADFEAMGQWIKGAKKYYIQPFTNRDTVPDKTLSTPSQTALSTYLETVKKYVPKAYIRGVDM